MPPRNEWMKENIIHIHDGILFSHKEKLNYDFCRQMDETRDHVKRNNPTLEWQLCSVLSHMQTLDYIRHESGGGIMRGGNKLR